MFVRWNKGQKEIISRAINEEQIAVPNATAEFL
jgi:hypothetical protein